MAEVLFFVIDSKTRAIASMIEVSYLIGEYMLFFHLPRMSARAYGSIEREIGVQGEYMLRCSRFIHFLSASQLMRPSLPSS